MVSSVSVRKRRRATHSKTWQDSSSSSLYHPSASLPHQNASDDESSQLMSLSSYEEDERKKQTVLLQQRRRQLLQLQQRQPSLIADKHYHRTLSDIDRDATTHTTAAVNTRTFGRQKRNAPMFDGRACARGCAGFSLVGVLFLSLIGYLIDTQPIFFKGVQPSDGIAGVTYKVKTADQVLPATTHAYQAALAYFVTLLVCFAYLHNAHIRILQHPTAQSILRDCLVALQTITQITLAHYRRYRNQKAANRRQEDGSDDDEEDATTENENEGADVENQTLVRKRSPKRRNPNSSSSNNNNSGAPLFSGRSGRTTPATTTTSVMLNPKQLFQQYFSTQRKNE